MTHIHYGFAICSASLILTCGLCQSNTELIPLKMALNLPLILKNINLTNMFSNKTNTCRYLFAYLTLNSGGLYISIVSNKIVKRYK